MWFKRQNNVYKMLSYRTADNLNKQETRQCHELQMYIVYVEKKGGWYRDKLG